MAATEATTRLLVGDPAGDDQILSSANYTAIIALETNEYRAAATACRAIAATFSTKVSLAVGPIRISLQHKFEHYKALADVYDFRAQGGGGSDSVVAGAELTGVSLSDMESTDSDTDRPPNKFKFGMFDNPPSTYKADRDAELESE